MEFSEAMNAMPGWYMESALCYVFLADYHERASMGQCQWFTRGRTLQELVGPQIVHFYDDKKKWLT